MNDTTPRRLLHDGLPGLLFLGFVSCATVPAPPPPGPEPTPVESIGLAERPTVAPSADVPATPIAGAFGLRSLCNELRDEERMTFTGNEVEQARAREVHAGRREAIAGGRYYVDVPPAGFEFQGYQLAEGQLVIARRTFSLGEGAEIYAAEPVEELAFPLSQDAAEKILTMRGEGNVVLRLVFRPAVSTMREELCMRLSGGRVVKLGAAVEGAYLVSPPDTILARHETQELADAMAASSPVAKPRVAIEKPIFSDGRAVGADVEASARTLGTELLSCYEEALKAKPTMRGRLVIAVRVRADGRLEEPEMQMSSLADEAVVGCVVTRLTSGRLSGVPGGARLSLPITFRDEAEAS
jgi:hypothetical protein